MHGRTLPHHPDGTLDIPALLAFHRSRFGDARMDGEGSGGEGGSGGGSGGGGQGGSGSGGDGYTPPASQADLDRIIEKRLARERERYSDYDELKAKADKHDALEAELGSDKDKAVKAARDEERAKARGEFVPRVVRAEFRAAAKGVLTDDQLTALLEDLDLSRYVSDKGDVDEEKVAKKVAAFAPGKGGNGNNNGSRDLGQGNRTAAGDKPGDQGRAMAEKRFGKRS